MKDQFSQDESHLHLTTLYFGQRSIDHVDLFMYLLNLALRSLADETIHSDVKHAELSMLNIFSLFNMK